MLPALSSVSPCMRVQHQCLKHSIGFQWKPGSNAKLLACVFSVSVTTLCHLIFLTFFIHTYHLGRCVLSTPLCLQFLASVSRPMPEDLSLSLAPLSGTPYLYLSGKLSAFQLSKRSLKLICLKSISADVCKCVLLCMSFSWRACVCMYARARARACVCVCMCYVICMVAVVMYMLLCNDFCCNVCAYF